MLPLTLDAFITFLQSLPVEVVTGITYIFCILSLMFLVKCFKDAGAGLFLCLAVVCGNIQVLKAVNYSFLNNPVALGTIAFSLTTMLVCSSSMRIDSGVRL